MSDTEAIKKAIRYFECIRNDAVAVLDSGFGTHPGESDLVYRNRKMYAELAISALGKQIEMKKYCDENDCADCPYHNTSQKDNRCMNDFIIDKE